VILYRMMMCDFRWDDDDVWFLEGMMMVWFWMRWWSAILYGMMKCDFGQDDDVWFWMGWWCVILDGMTICDFGWWTKVLNILCNNVLLCQGDWWHILGGYKHHHLGSCTPIRTQPTHFWRLCTGFKMIQSLCIIHMPSPGCVHIYLQEGLTTHFGAVFYCQKKKKKPWKIFPLGF
jgi:hypothetical protein